MKKYIQNSFSDPLMLLAFSAQLLLSASESSNQFLLSSKMYLFFVLYILDKKIYGMLLKCCDLL